MKKKEIASSIFMVVNERQMNSRLNFVPESFCLYVCDFHNLN